MDPVEREIRVRQTIEKLYYNKIQKPTEGFHQFNHDWDLNLNRFPNNLLQLGQEQRNLLESVGGPVFPNDTAEDPGNNNLI
jgi:hypothetical protein